MCRAIATFLLSSVFLASVADAQSAAKEPALAISAKDPKLNWGPCPPFMPRGCEIAVLHGDPAKDNADVFLRLPANASIPNHWHTSAERMVLVSGEMQVAYEGQAPVTLKPGMYAYGPAKLAHAGTCAKGEPCVLFIAFESPIDGMSTESKSK